MPLARPIHFATFAQLPTIEKLLIASILIITIILCQISELFGGMEVCGISIVVGKDGKEYILSATDSTLPLMGDTQEDDRRHIADLVVTRMQVISNNFRILNVFFFQTKWKITKKKSIAECLSSAIGQGAAIAAIVRLIESRQSKRRKWPGCSANRILFTWIIDQWTTTTDSGAIYTWTR